MKSSNTSASDTAALALPFARVTVNDLFNRRVLQIVGVYLAAAWPFFQFVNWLVDYYVLSPHLVELCLFTVLMLLPAVLLLAYTRGMREFDHVTRLEKVGIPCNLVGALIVLLVFFGGKDLGSAQRTVTMTTLEGTEVERVIPKSAFRKRVALFFFENATDDHELDWTRTGVPDALEADLIQDLFITIKSPPEFAERLAQAGFADGFTVPLALRRELAQEFNLDYVFGGTVHRSESDDLRIETQLYDAKSGQLVKARTFAGVDLLALIDELSVQLKHDLEVPSKHIDEVVDLPVSEVLTSSMMAFQAYTEAAYRWHFEHDYARAGALLEQAVTEDPTFAFAHLMLGVNHLHQGQMPSALASYRAASQHDYRLPERYRFLVNTGLLNMENKPDEALQSAEQWHTLFPDDIEALEVLAVLYSMLDEPDEAIAARRQILDLDPSEQAQLLEIGDLLRDEARYEEALGEYRAYVGRVPDNTDGYLRIGRTLHRTGDLEAEREAYSQALAIDANDPSLLGELADVELKLGRYDEALRQYERALELSRTPSEEARAHLALASYRSFRGQLGGYLEALRTAWDVEAQFKSPLHHLIGRVSRARHVARAGEAGQARQLIAEARAHPASANPQVAALIDLSEAAVFVETGRADEVPAIVDRLEETMSELGIRRDLGLMQLRGTAYLKLERWEEAVETFRADLEKTPYNEASWRYLGEAYHRLGRREDAEQAFEKSLTYFPTAPKSHLSFAKLMIDLERADAAREHLQQALAAWVAADDDFEPAVEARRLLASLPPA